MSQKYKRGLQQKDLKKAETNETLFHFITVEANIKTKKAIRPNYNHEDITELDFYENFFRYNSMVFSRLNNCITGTFSGEKTIGITALVKILLKFDFFKESVVNGTSKPISENLDYVYRRTLKNKKPEKL